MAITEDDIIISQVETEKDIIEANLCVSEAFGRQTKDAVRNHRYMVFAVLQSCGL
jgi:aminocarboxymuconate-semialdehyde decarboxylase